MLTAEDGPIRLGERCIVMENAVLRGRAGHPVVLGDRVLVGPHAHVNGAEVGDEAFVATGASLFPGSRVGAGAEVRINAVLHVNSALPDGAELPIGWVAVGDPAQMFPPKAHDEIWAVQRTLDFAGTVTGLDARGARRRRDGRADARPTPSSTAATATTASSATDVRARATRPARAARPRRPAPARARPRGTARAARAGSSAAAARPRRPTA